MGVSLKEGGRIIRTHFAYNGKLFWITAKNTKFENAEPGSSLRGDLTYNPKSDLADVNSNNFCNVVAGGNLIKIFLLYLPTYSIYPPTLSTHRLSLPTDSVYPPTLSTHLLYLPTDSSYCEIMQHDWMGTNSSRD